MTCQYLIFTFKLTGFGFFCNKKRNSDRQNQIDNRKEIDLHIVQEMN